jgi:hypothetical protein
MNVRGHVEALEWVWLVCLLISRTSIESPRCVTDMLLRLRDDGSVPRYESFALTMTFSYPISTTGYEILLVCAAESIEGRTSRQ